MKISKSSWHYRFTELYGVDGFSRRCEDGRHTTCSYIRAVFYAAIRAGIAWSAFAVLLAVVLWFAVSMVSVPVAILSGVVILPKTLLDAMVVPCAVGWMAVGGGLAIYLISLLVDKLKECSEKRQSLLAQIYKDKKDGICTLVEIV